MKNKEAPTIRKATLKKKNDHFFLGIIFAISFLAIFVTSFTLLVPIFSNIDAFSWLNSYLSYRSKKHFGQQEIRKFTSEKEFKKYLDECKENQELMYNSGFGASFPRSGIGIKDEEISTAAPDMWGGIKDIYKNSGVLAPNVIPSRISETNVQVAGIDEPDIVKTDGNEIYYSSQNNNYYRNDIMPMPYKNKGISLVKAFPPADLAIDSEILENGNLLLADNILMIIQYDKIYGYNITNLISPTQEWKMELNNSRVTASRLYNGKLYLITNNDINYSQPCPIKPFTIGDNSLDIKCEEIYHPVNPVDVDNTYVASIIDPKSGKVEKNISFVGSSNNSLIYMSPNAIYVSYYYNGDFVSFFVDLFTQKCKDIIPPEISLRLKKLDSYELSSTTKFAELQNILEKYYNSLTNDERLKIETELENRARPYFKEHGRDLERTGIFKISNNDLKILASGSVPGRLLNQFSLDEFENHLRVASTTGGRGSMLLGSQDSTNDVYVLDKDLKITGEALGLGEKERIYSVRFLEDKGYVVTFRETDPFYVLDLKNPKNPEMKGELKIPGYSSYLHPIAKDKILGIGKENNKVKISLFDVSSPKKPEEVSKYSLDEYWSEILNTHHAFLLDSKHNIFFMPGGKGAYIFSYKGDQLTLVKAVSNIIAQRAIYLNDYLYIIGNNKITVLNEADWEKINELDL